LALASAFTFFLCTQPDKKKPSTIIIKILQICKQKALVTSILNYNKAEMQVNELQQ